MRKIVPKGIMRKVATGYDMVVSTLDCEGHWKKFLRSKAGDPRYTSVCHRLNVGLDGKPPNLDDVDAIPRLESQARNYLRKTSPGYFDRDYATAHDHIKVVARRLIASLFYFQDNDQGRSHTISPAHSPTPRQTTVSGLLRCRLSPNMDAQFSQLIHSGPKFRVRHGDVVHSLQPQFDLRTFAAKIEFDAVTSGGTRRRSIEVRFPRKSESWEQISDF